MKTDGVGGFVEEFKFSLAQKRDLNNLLQSFRARVNEEQAVTFLSSLEKGIETWLFSCHSNALLPTEKGQLSEVQEIRKAAQVLLNRIDKAHAFTHYRIKDESRFAYGGIHETVVCDELREPLENLIITSQSLLNESSRPKLSTGHNTYRISHHLCDVVLTALEKSKIKIRLGKNTNSPFIAILAYLLDIEEVLRGLLTVTSTKQSENIADSIGKRNTTNVAIGMSRSHGNWLKRKEQY